MELQVYQVDGTETGRTVALDADVFGVEPNDHLLWLDVRRIQAHRRQGTHKTKERSEVAGSTRKLYRQKGTGMARAGSVKSPIRRSGGRTFGPRPRAYHQKLNKKSRRLARCSALTYKAREEALRVVESLGFDVPNTRRLVELIEALALGGQRVLVLTEKNEDALYRSSRNLASVLVREARNASTEDLLGAGVIVFEEGAVAVLAETLAEDRTAALAAAVEVAEEEAVEAEAVVEVAEEEAVEAEAAVEVAEEEAVEAEAVEAEAEAPAAEAADDDEAAKQ